MNKNQQTLKKAALLILKERKETFFIGNFKWVTQCNSNIN